MIKIVMIATAMMGIVFFSVGPTMATLSIPSESEVCKGSIETGYGALEWELANQAVFKSQQFFVQRKSSKPPGESHSGRASSSKAGSVPESGRESGRTLDLSEHPSTLETESTSHQRHEESMVTPKKEGDPLEGGRKSQPATKRRGGIVK